MQKSIAAWLDLAQWMKALAMKSEDVSLTPGTYSRRGGVMHMNPHSSQHVQWHTTSINVT